MFYDFDAKARPRQEALLVYNRTRGAYHSGGPASEAMLEMGWCHHWAWHLKLLMSIHGIARSICEPASANHHVTFWILNTHA